MFESQPREHLRLAALNLINHVGAKQARLTRLGLRFDQVDQLIELCGSNGVSTGDINQRYRFFGARIQQFQIHGDRGRHSGGNRQWAEVFLDSLNRRFELHLCHAGLDVSFENEQRF